MRTKFGFTQGLNVARLGLDETQVITACQIADRMDYDSIWAMDHSNVPQWKNAVVNDAWIMLAAIGALTQNVEVGTCVTDAIRRHPSAIALSTITLDRVTKGRGMLGIGAGEAQNVVDFGIEFTKPVTKFKEQLEVIHRLFESGVDNHVSYNGEFYKLNDASLQTEEYTQAQTSYIYRCQVLQKHLNYVHDTVTVGFLLVIHRNCSEIMLM